MSTKRKAQNCHALVVLSQLLLERLDELNATTPVMVKFKEDLTGFCEELNNQISNTDTVQKSTYFNDIAHKVDTIIRKNFNPQM